MPESAFGHIFYGSRPEKNTTSNSLQALGPVRQISELEDQDLAQVILDDGVDILIDLAGHNPGNRLIAISRRLAPIQISWLDYFSTTGVPAMDYWFSDKYLTPDGSSESFSESLILLPDTRLCYSPPKFNIDPARSIRTENEIVFGSFNRLGKLVDELIAVWTNILNRVEHSRLLLKAYEFQDKRVRNHTIARFEDAGLSPGQLELRSASPYSQLLSEYADIDIALDTFPFTGCATTCDALWMGVPVVSCYGESVVSRQGLSILQNIGKSDWLADQADVYTATAIGLAESIRVNGFDRKELRETVKTSTLCNAPAFGKAFSEQLRVLWRTYCEQSN
jgi:predicted O-linked N-acetylglucosamine transferase (SPINDLY family)